MKLIPPAVLQDWKERWLELALVDAAFILGLICLAQGRLLAALAFHLVLGYAVVQHVRKAYRMERDLP